MPRHDLPTCARWPAFLASALLLTCCGEKAPEPPSPDVLAANAAAEARRAAEEISRQVESFTGAPARIVWSQYQRTGAADPRAIRSGHFLMGLDTRDGLGARALLAKEDNYSRPIISPDGNVILYTRKTVTLDAQDVKHYTAVIMRTDWKGSVPVEISDGYAVDIWRDPATKIEWVYAVRDLIPSPMAAIEAKKLVRFQLADPDEQELVWDQTKVTPDNIQLSRDGRRASGQFPWPQAGLLVLDGKKSLKKQQEGAWPSLAPDNSYASWLLDPGQKNLAVFAEGVEDSRTVPLTTLPELAKGAVNHPRWSNHPRFLCLTGPHLPAEDHSAAGSASEVFIGKFSEKLDKVESWLRITSNDLNDNQPDIWIEGGETAELSAFSQVHASRPAAPPWPSKTDSLIFRWEDAATRNEVKLSGGRQLDCKLDAHAAARIGRDQELLLDAGTFTPTAESAAIMVDALQSGVPLTVEFMLHLEGDPLAAHGTLATFPHLRLSIQGGTISAETSGGIISIGPVQGAVTHFAASVGDQGYAFLLQEADGRTLTKISAAKPRSPSARNNTISFGGLRGKGIGMSRIAVFARNLPPDEIHDRVKVLSSLELQPPSASIVLRGKLVQSSAMPAPGDAAGTQALISCVYDIVKVTEGSYPAQRILVRHWGLMDGRLVQGFPRKNGLEFDLILQPAKDHPQLEGVPVQSVDAPGLEPWYDVSPPVAGR